MSLPSSEIETEVCAFLKSQDERYRQAIHLVDAAATEIGRDDGGALLVERLQVVMDEVQKMDKEWSRLSNSWSSIPPQSSGPVRQAKQSVESTLKELIQRVDATEQQARDARSQLLPRLNVAARRRQMQKLYGTQTSSNSEVET